MKLELDENSYWLSLWSMVGLFITVIAVSALIYSNHKNKLILQADSCEKAVLIEGDAYGRGLAICKIKTQQ